MSELNYADDVSVRSMMMALGDEQIDSWSADDFYRTFKECQYNAGACLTEKQALKLVLALAQMQKTGRMLPKEKRCGK